MAPDMRQAYDFSIKTHNMSTRCRMHSTSSPVDDAARVQEVQASRDVHHDLTASLVPPIFIQVIPRDGLPQITALQPGEDEQQSAKPVAEDMSGMVFCASRLCLCLCTAYP